MELPSSEFERIYNVLVESKDKISPEKNLEVLIENLEKNKGKEIEIEKIIYKAFSCKLIESPHLNRNHSLLETNNLDPEDTKISLNKKRNSSFLFSFNFFILISFFFF